ncbi:hypothetical protein MLIT_50850 [Mycolicibacterium litorale]|uniref:Uncharacterized protein n=1 Tax=Mycolicibacterium litorale TaxID=758802 RepID=A0AAD1IRG3_9MYCO|nr:hypothetical protein MLIT_50850 [Mycolicibacterium litorale]
MSRDGVADTGAARAVDAARVTAAADRARRKGFMRANGVTPGSRRPGETPRL